MGYGDTAYGGAPLTKVVRPASRLIQ